MPCRCCIESVLQRTHSMFEHLCFAAVILFAVQLMIVLLTGRLAPFRYWFAMLVFFEGGAEVLDVRFAEGLGIRGQGIG